MVEMGERGERLALPLRFNILMGAAVTIEVKLFSSPKGKFNTV